MGGKPFTKTYRPKNPGRKPSQLKKYIKDNNVSIDDIRLMIKQIWFSKRTAEDLQKIMADPKEPMLVRMLTKAFLHDYNNSSINNLMSLIDKVFGAPDQNITVSGALDVTKYTPEERRAILDEYARRRVGQNNNDEEPSSGQTSAGSIAKLPGKTEEIIEAEFEEA